MTASQNSPGVARGQSPRPALRGILAVQDKGARPWSPPQGQVKEKGVAAPWPCPACGVWRVREPGGECCCWACGGDEQVTPRASRAEAQSLHHGEECDLPQKMALRLVAWTNVAPVAGRAKGLGGRACDSKRSIVSFAKHRGLGVRF